MTLIACIVHEQQAVYNQSKSYTENDRDQKPRHFAMRSQAWEASPECLSAHLLYICFLFLIFFSFFLQFYEGE